MIKPRIAVVANSTSYTFYFRLGLLRRLQELGFEVFVISPKDHYSTKLIAEGFDFIDLPLKLYSVKPLKEALVIRKLIRIYRALNLDFILHFTAKPNIYGTLAAKIVNIPSIAITTGLGILRHPRNKFSGQVLFQLYKLAARYTKELWFLNRDDESFFLNHKLVHSDKTYILPSEGVDITWYRPLSHRRADKSNTFRFLYAGRIVWSKGMKEFFEAAQIIKEKYKNVTFEIVGFVVPDHPDGVSYDLIQQWHKSKIIHYHGETDDIRPYLERADCVVLPSYYEGVSRFLLEAASTAKPIIATDVVGCREVVDHGVNGLLCKVRNVKDLVQKMEHFLEMGRNQREKMGLAGRKKVIQQFDEQLIIQHYLQALDRHLPSKIKRRLKLPMLTEIGY